MSVHRQIPIAKLNGRDREGLRRGGAVRTERHARTSSANSSTMLGLSALETASTGRLSSAASARRPSSTIFATDRCARMRNTVL